MRKGLAFILALCLVIPMLIASFFLISMRSWAFDRDFYKKALSGDQIFEAVEAAASLELEDNLMIDGVKVDARAFNKALFTALPREEIRNAVTALVDASFDGLEGKSASTSVKLDTERLALILEKNAKLFASAYSEAVPEGSNAEFDLKNLAVRPKGMTAQAFAAKLLPLVEPAVKEASQRIREVGAGFVIPVVRAPGLPFKGNLVKTVDASFIGMLVASGVLLLLGFFLWPKPWGGRFVYAGTVIILGSVFVLAAGIIGGAMLNADNIMGGIRALGADIPPGFVSPQLKGYLSDVVGTITRGFFLTGIIAASVGAGVLSMRWVAAAKEI